MWWGMVMRGADVIIVMRTINQQIHNQDADEKYGGVERGGELSAVLIGGKYLQLVFHGAVQEFI